MVIFTLSILWKNQASRCSDLSRVVKITLILIHPYLFFKPLRRSFTLWKQKICWRPNISPPLSEIFVEQTKRNLINFHYVISSPVRYAYYHDLIQKSHCLAFSPHSIHTKVPLYNNPYNYLFPFVLALSSFLPHLQKLPL